jgi:hypothetical protein
MIIVSVFVHQVRKYLGKAAGTQQSKGSDLVVGAERIDSSTEFVILASTGIWEVRCLLYISLHFHLLPYFPCISYIITGIPRPRWDVLMHKQ